MRHYIADESIGGIEREYVEVERKADVGDYVVHGSAGIYGIFERTDGIFAFVNYDGSYNGRDAWYLSKTVTVEPTDIVRIDGERYRLVNRHAEVGEKVLIVSAYETYDKYKNGDIITAEKTGSIGLMNFELATDEAEGNPEGYVVNGEYRVLEALKPVEAEPLTVDETQASPQVIDMLANLARRVTQLEAQLRDTQRNVETFAQQTETNSEDIRLLDERTQVPSKKFNLSDLDGKELSVYSATDSAEGITVITTVGIDERDEKMYVLESRVLAND